MDFLRYLTQPEPVISVQNFFGIKYLKRGRTANGPEYYLSNKFWYYVFLFGTTLGDEVFYSSFIPFWFWNIDGAVGRRFITVWALVMYIGQGLKDIIKWPRPGPLVVKLHNKWSQEYGMPSTHAMVGVSIPFSILFYTMNRYSYDAKWGWVLAVTWCTIVCLSRLYLGMHTVLDIIVGLLLAIGLMMPLVPLVDTLDNFFLTSPISPTLLMITSILLIVYYPSSDKWTPTRGDTTVIVSVWVGVLIGAWLNFHNGQMSVAELVPPYTVIWPSSYMMFLTVLRTVLGFLGVLLVRQLAKSVSRSILCAVFRQDVSELRNLESVDNKYRTFIDLATKYFTYGMIGLSISCFLPNFFRCLRIERPTFYTEI